jgi:hypothetical protein
MNILITGCTAIQINSPRKQTDIITSLPCLAQGFRDMGHTVEWRDVNVGEDLSQFDKVIISLAPLSNWGTRYMGGCLWALMMHPNVSLTVDDWQTRGIHKSAMGLYKDQKYFEKVIWSHWKDRIENHPGPWSTFPTDFDFRQILLDGVRALAHPVWPWKMLVPCWDGGDRRILGLPSMELMHWDPTAYQRPYVHTPEDPEQRHRAWVYASLTSKMDWLQKNNFKWPVLKYGNTREGQPKLDEQSLVNVYCRNWGVLSPPHNVSSAGWWRVRFSLAARSGCVMFCEADEARIMGPSYRLIRPMIEQLPAASLANIALDQQADLAKITWSKDRILDQLGRFL